MKVDVADIIERRRLGLPIADGLPDLQALEVEIKRAVMVAQAGIHIADVIERIRPALLIAKCLEQCLRQQQLGAGQLVVGEPVVAVPQDQQAVRKLLLIVVALGRDPRLLAQRDRLLGVSGAQIPGSAIKRCDLFPSGRSADRTSSIIGDANHCAHRLCRCRCMCSANARAAALFKQYGLF